MTEDIINIKDINNTARATLPTVACARGVLNSHGLLQISGSQAKQLLQGQLTCDMNALQPSRSVLAACCNAQGRVISNFMLYMSPITLPQSGQNIEVDKVGKADKASDAAEIGRFASGVPFTM